MVALNEKASRFLDSWLRGSRRNVPLSRSDLPAELFLRRCFAQADIALLPKSPLRVLYDLGAALGEYELQLLPHRPLDYGSGAFQLWPDIGPLVECIRRLPGNVLDTVPILASLARVHPSSGKSADPISPRMFIDCVREYIPYNSLLDDPSTWEEWGTHSYREDLFIRIYSTISNSLQTLKYESMPLPPGNETKKLKWDNALGEIRADGELLRKKVATQAKNLRMVLDCFERNRWPRSIDEPFSKKDPLSKTLEHTFNPQAVYRAVEELNEGLKVIRFSASEGATLICWGWQDESAREKRTKSG